MSTTNPTHASGANDPLGHALLAHRIEQIPGELAGMMVRGLPQLRPLTLSSERFLVTGTGSSEAHARYFCNLVNLYTDRTAAYLPLSAFLGMSRELIVDKTLVVFSQGVSPNAQIALRRHKEFRHSILFTSTTPYAAREAGKPERADLITDIAGSGGDLIYFPLAEEYSTLIRLVGPMCGYLACMQFVAQLAGAHLEPPRPGQILPLLHMQAPADLRSAILSKPQRFADGFNIITAAPISDYAQNLACKFMEGLFWPCPPISDFLQFAHGPFQQATAHDRPVIILQGNSPAEAELVRRSMSMLASAGLEGYVIPVNAPPLYSIFGFEAIFNNLVLEAVRHLEIDQVNWPGKGRDDLLYGFCTDAGAGTQAPEP
ncbi:MAG: creatininase [Opitutaceae bacterium]